MKKSIALCLAISIVTLCTACSSKSSISVIESNPDHVIKQIEIKNENAYPTKGDGTFCWFDVKADDFIKKLQMQFDEKTKISLEEGESYYYVHNNDVEVASLKVGTGIVPKDYIEEIGMATKSDNESDAKLVGQTIDKLINMFNPDDADTIENELYIFKAAPDGTPKSRCLICGNIEYIYNDDDVGSFTIQPIMIDTTESSAYLPEK